MNLIIDQGNTLFKVALFNDNELISKESFSYSNIDLFYIWLSKKNIKTYNVIISSVVNNTIDLSKVSVNKIIQLDSTTKLPISNKYKTPKTLGDDRLANAVAAYSISPKQNSLIIDFGTCIKYDIINSKGEYLGGNISLGLKMRYKALNQFTDQLPLIQPKETVFMHGVDTESSIICGVQSAIFHEMEGFIEQYSKEFRGLTIFMTGGDLKYFDKSFKNHIFANSNLTLIGLNEILKHNV